MSEDERDDAEISRQIRTLYIRSNKLLRMFSYCTIDVKKELFRSYCSSLYCWSSWSDYRKATYRKLTVAFNNIHRRMLGLPWRCSASAMYANYDLPNIDTVIRRSLFGFIQRLSVSQNSIVRSIEQSWFVRIKLWDFWSLDQNSLPLIVSRCISFCIINQCSLYLREKIKINKPPSYDR